MTAIVCTKYGSPEVLEITEIDQPIAKENEILINIKATTVSAADVRVRGFRIPKSFWLPARLMLGLRKPKKAILGMEISGVVKAIGSVVTKFKVGDKVFACTLQTFGGYAEYIALPEDGVIAKMPEYLSFEEAAAIPIGGRTAYYYLKHLAKIAPHHNILIYGASGSVGTYAIQLAKYFGAHVTGVCSTANIELVKSLGADKVIDYTTPHFINSFEQYDIVFVTIDRCPFKVLKKTLTEEGVYLNIGRPLPSFDMIKTSIFDKKKKIIVGKYVPESPEYLEALRRLVESFKIHPIIDRAYKLNAIVEAHHYVDKGHKRGNVVITP